MVSTSKYPTRESNVDESIYIKIRRNPKMKYLRDSQEALNMFAGIMAIWVGVSFICPHYHGFAEALPAVQQPTQRQGCTFFLQTHRFCQTRIHGFGIGSGFEPNPKYWSNPPNFRSI